MSYIYLASPYSHKSQLVRHRRYLDACQATAQLLSQGIFVYSPIVHCHELAQRFALPKSFSFWQRYNFAMLEEASGLYILKLPGWEKSEGVKAEIHFANQHNIKIIPLSFPLEELNGE